MDNPCGSEQGSKMAALRRMDLDWYRKRTKAKKSVRISIRTRVVQMVNRTLKDTSKFFKLKRDASMME